VAVVDITTSNLPPARRRDLPQPLLGAASSATPGH
jgi:hypothetical protein